LILGGVFPLSGWTRYRYFIFSGWSYNKLETLLI
jgi:hypothetical protein